jgi:hypothetical protein
MRLLCAFLFLQDLAKQIETANGRVESQVLRLEQELKKVHDTAASLVLINRELKEKKQVNAVFH